MAKTFSLGTLLGLRLTVLPSAILATGLLSGFFAGVGYWALGLSVLEAIMGGMLAGLIHWIGEIWHQFGHALAARRVGYPMQGIEFWGLLGRSVYPTDEPDLPSQIHIRRALGGAPASFLFALLAGIFLARLNPTDGVLYWLVVFAVFENLFVFGLGAFLPLGFTDGSTLLRYWGK
ncbi:MAG: hypothetical protein Fur0022_19070 [Anaerolineales bacterium]